MTKLFVFVVLTVVSAHNESRPSFRMEVAPVFKQVPCSLHTDRAHEQALEDARCGEPREVMLKLTHSSAAERISPSVIWVKKCVGICGYKSRSRIRCTPEKAIKSFDVRIYSSKLQSQRCATFDVEEHVSCSCPFDPDTEMFLTDESYENSCNLLAEAEDPETTTSYPNGDEKY